MSTRRQMLSAGLGLGLGAPFLLPEAARAQAAVRLRTFWWGSRERSDRTMKANALFTARYPHVTVDGESVGWGDYWTKLATQTVGRNAPDMFQMDYRYLFEYARRNALLELDRFIPATLDIGGWDKAGLDVGRANGKLYGVNLGNNASTTIYNRTLLTELGIAEPSPETTWEQLVAKGEEITRKVNRPDFYGLADGTDREPMFEYFLRQKGRPLYTAEEKLGFGVAEAEEWLTFWSDARKRKACVPADIQALDKDTIETNPLSLGRAAIAYPHSNQLVGYQQINRNKLAITTLPNGGPGAKPGHYLKPSQFFSIYARTPRAEEAVKLLNFFVTDPEAAKALGVERGVLVDPRQRAALDGSLDELGKMQVAYIDLVTPLAGPIPPPPPKGAGEIAFLLRRIGEQVGFGRQTPRVAAQQFVSEANDILSRG
ncbi:extracellular solute-binding protein [Roseomonas sp. OT10]|uniref:ABC transporter substrate-binding protein n=1 Tax=Roseomonas cutis TaxID=2897332 RepID=UPI001E630AC8|nr:extracellular solute-binding protein [Roseomonas sp. OT10]UFN48848.1 extracellular solute-binding protein [Roseomonas sp. OT10]